MQFESSAQLPITEEENDTKEALSESKSESESESEEDKV